MGETSKDDDKPQSYVIYTSWRDPGKDNGTTARTDPGKDNITAEYGQLPKLPQQSVNYDQQLPPRKTFTREEIQEQLSTDPNKIIGIILDTNDRQEIAHLLRAMRSSKFSKGWFTLVRNARIPGVEYMNHVQATDTVKDPENPISFVLYPKVDKKGSLGFCYQDADGIVQSIDVIYKPKRGFFKRKEAEFRVNINNSERSFSSLEEMSEVLSTMSNSAPTMFPSTNPDQPVAKQPPPPPSSSQPLPSLYTEDLSPVSEPQSGPQAQGPQANPPNHGPQQVQGPQVHGPQQRRQQAGPLTFSGGASQHQRSATVALSLDDRALVHENVIPRDARAQFSKQVAHAEARDEFGRVVAQGAVPKPMISSDGNQLTVTFTPKEMRVDQSPIKIDQQTGKYHVGDRSFDSLQEVIQGFERAAPNHTRTAGPQLPPPPKR